MATSAKKQVLTKELLLKKYRAYIQKNSSIPSLAALVDLGISRAAIRHYFGSNTQLFNYIKKNFPETLERVIDETRFTPARFSELKKEAKKFKRFIVTTAIVDKPVHEGFLKSLKSYCEKNQALLLILPCQDVASRSKVFKWTLDPKLSNEYIVFDDLGLNSNIWISTIKMSAKQINPLTGLSRISQRNGSTIFPSPKQQLDFVTSSARKKIPRALMSTGAITVNDYSTDRYMSGRTSYIAENDHVMGAIVVEVKNSKEFFFRQIQASEKTGAFVDCGLRYQSDGSVSLDSPEAIVWGDYHSGSTDQVVKSVTRDIVKSVQPYDMIMHDFYDGKSISHHDMKKPLIRVKKVMENKHSLRNEIREMRDELNDLTQWVDGQVILVKSNHDEVLERYLKEARYANDDNNHYYALDLAKKMLEGEDPLKYAVEVVEGLTCREKVTWLQRDEEYKIANVECGAHGDGWQSSMQYWEKALGNCVIGHSHSAAILRGVFRVGTSSLLQLDYNVGPSNWTQTHCLVYSDGSRQLINIINGEWRLKEGALTREALRKLKT